MPEPEEAGVARTAENAHVPNPESNNNEVLYGRPDAS